MSTITQATSDAVTDMLNDAASSIGSTDPKMRAYGERCLLQALAILRVDRGALSEAGMHKIIGAVLAMTNETIDAGTPASIANLAAYNAGLGNVVGVIR